MNVLTEQQLNEFINEGVLVIENIYSDEEIEEIRGSFHNQLEGIGINHQKILNKEEDIKNGPRIKGEASNIFYNKWKLKINLNEKIYHYAKDLLVNTFGIKRDNFDHPYNKFNDITAYIDRVCYRTPDIIRSESGLSMHIDRNPTDPYLSKGNLKKWRPIQALLTLTDHYGSECGGLQVVKRFHTITDEYFKGKVFEGDGEFCRLNSKSHTSLEKTLQTIQAPKGSLIFWDNRLPHATCNKLAGNDTREVVYIGYLPNTDLNRNYINNQAENIKLNIYPPAYIKDKNIKADKDWIESELTPLEKKLLGL